MSQNVKYTEYTVISNTGISNKKRVAVFNDFEIKAMVDYIHDELFDMFAFPVIITRETITKNFHYKVGGFVKQTNSRMRRMEILNDKNTGVYNWLKSPQNRSK